MNRDVVHTLVAYYQGLGPDTLGALKELYAEDAWFKDPFHEFCGRDRLMDVYREMFRNLQEPRFKILKQIVDHDQAVLIWDFRFRFRGKEWCIHGSTHFGFNAEGLVVRHRDYWDAAEELYEKLPMLGALLRMIRKRIGKAGEGHG